MLLTNQQTALTLLWHAWLPDMHLQLDTALKQPRKAKPAATTLTLSYQDSRKSYSRPFIPSLSLPRILTSRPILAPVLSAQHHDFAPAPNSLRLRYVQRFVLFCMLAGSTLLR